MICDRKLYELRFVKVCFSENNYTRFIKIITCYAPPNQKCMYGAALAVSGNHWLYLVIFGMPLEPYYFKLVLVWFR